MKKKIYQKKTIIMPAISERQTNEMVAVNSRMSQYLNKCDISRVGESANIVKTVLTEKYFSLIENKNINQNDLCTVVCIEVLKLNSYAQ